MLTLDRMPKKKTPAPEGREERKPIQVPVAWFAVIRKLAAANKQPHTWYLLDLINREAQAAGLDDVPPLPWEEDEAAKSAK